MKYYPKIKIMFIALIAICAVCSLVVAQPEPPQPNPSSPQAVAPQPAPPDPLVALQVLDRAVGQLTLSRDQHVQLQTAVRVIEAALIECGKADAPTEAESTPEQ